MKTNAFFKLMISASLILFTLFSCKEKENDPVTPTCTTCVNGTCNNGKCDCEEGFTGDGCDKLIVPDSMHVKEVVIYDFPGICGDWDSDDKNYHDADVYVAIYNRDVKVFDSKAKFVENYDGGVHYFYSDFYITKPEDTYELHIYDKDSDDDTKDQLIYKAYFVPFDKNGVKFPAKVYAYEYSVDHPYSCSSGFYSYSSYPEAYLKIDKYQFKK